MVTMDFTLQCFQVNRDGYSSRDPSQRCRHLDGRSTGAITFTTLWNSPPWEDVEKGLSCDVMAFWVAFIK